MKKSKLLFGVVAATAAIALTFSGCGAAGDFNKGGMMDMGLGFAGAPMGSEDESGNYVYDSIVEQGYFDTATAPSSYFSLDRNTANYAQIRSQLKANSKIANDSVRTEELINYFSYDYPMPENGEQIAVTGYLSDCPWNAGHKLATFGIRTEERLIEAECNNYVFLIDTSGSMCWKMNGEQYNRLELVKLGIEKLLDGLDGKDRISIVTYAGSTGTLLEPTLATESGKTAILKAVKKLVANGSTNGAGGLQHAYELAEGYYAEGGNNRVILLTDGDFNVGMSDAAQLKKFIREKAQSGVYLSVVGVGLGNMRDDIMETLALAGNGNYAYLDSEKEAEKIFSEELGGTLVTVAKDAKAGVTFNPDMVSRYRMIGYDMKTMSEDEFNDENKDAGEIGSNLTVTVMYELELASTSDNTENAHTMSLTDAQLVSAEIRYKSAETGEQKSVTSVLTGASGTSNDSEFAACVAEFGLVLRNSQFRGTASLPAVMERLNGLGDYVSGDDYKAEFQSLVELAIASKYYV